MKATKARFITPISVAVVLLTFSAVETGYLIHLGSERRVLATELATFRGAALPADAAAVERQILEASSELSKETARLTATEARIQAIETAVPDLKDQEVRSLGHVEALALEAADFIDTLSVWSAMLAERNLPPDEANRAAQKALAWFSQVKVISGMEDEPTEIARLHAATIAKRLALDGAVTAAVRAQIEREFTQLAAAGLTHSHCPSDDSAAWRARRNSAANEAAQRVEALIPASQRRADVVAQSLALGCAFFSKVTTQPDGHGSMTVGFSLPGMRGWDF